MYIVNSHNNLDVMDLPMVVISVGRSWRFSERMCQPHHHEYDVSSDFGLVVVKEGLGTCPMLTVVD